MAQQIKKKFIGNDQVGANQVLIENGSALRAMDGVTEVELVKVLSSEAYLNGFKVLESSGLIDSNRLPSYVDDVLEFSDSNAFPLSGETGKIYIALDTNKQYRWSGSTYVQITSGAVDSVNGETGLVVLSAGDILMDSEATTIEDKLVSLDLSVGGLDSDLQALGLDLQDEITSRENADAAIQLELDDTQTGAGLEADGSYLANGAMNYIGSATSLKNADELLDAQIKINADGLAQEIIDRAADVDAEETRALAAEATLQDNIDAEEARALAAEGVLQGNIDTVAANLAQEIIDRAADVDAEETRALAAESALDGRVTTLESIAWYNEKFVVDSTIISNGFVTLSNTPVSGSIVANVDRLSIFEGASEDFTVSGAVMTFLNQLVSPGNQNLQVGDEIRVKYQA